MKSFKQLLSNILPKSDKKAGYKNHGKLNKNLFNSLNYSELVKLSKFENINEQIQFKVKVILNNPIVDNSIQPKTNIELQSNQKPEKYIRIASWNINRSFNTDNIKSLFLNPDLFASGLKLQNLKKIKKIKEQANILKLSDIIILSEVDAGMPRSNYKRVIEELAKAMGYNYAYGVEFLEVDPAQLDLEDYKWSEKKELIKSGVTETSKVDIYKYRGLHGNAILSRFPLKNVRIIRLPQPYDWYDSEKNEPARMEIIRRYVMEKFFKEGVTREVRIGGRIALIADIDVPGFNTKITLISTHIENRTSPKYRTKQVKFILENIKNTTNPIILAGDFNTSGYDAGPLKSHSLKAHSFFSVPFVMIKSILGLPNIIRRYSDPTVKNIPIIFPNREKELFDTIRETKFSDGKSFDFKGQKEFSLNRKKGAFSDSNERRLKGFKPTFAFKRSFGFAKYKLDWIFVKSSLENPYNEKGEYKLTPMHGRTLYELNYAQKDMLSDHAPVTLDIAFQDIKK